MENLQTNNKSVPTSRIVDQLVKSVEKKEELLKFIRWYAVPEPWREPKLQKEFASENGLSPDTLVDWKKLNGFYDAVNLWASAEWVKEKYPNIIGGIYRTALKGNLDAVKLLMLLANYKVPVIPKDETEESEPKQLNQYNINFGELKPRLAEALMEKISEEIKPEISAPEQSNDQPIPEGTTEQSPEQPVRESAPTEDIPAS